MGDFSAIKASKELGTIESKVFWILWLLGVVVTMVIFLNFVVAEACASYNRVNEYLESVVLLAQCELIVESEEMMMNRNKNSSKCPRYIIVRSVEN
jgi:hypothetical protein